jgi:uncharacterized protein
MGLIDAWIGRAAQPLPEALAAVVGLAPAVVVTGGSSGIGLALAQEFGLEAREARVIVLVARSAERLLVARKVLTAAGVARVVPLVLDVTRIDAAQRIETELAAEGLYLDILVNCAGVGLAGRFAEHSSEAIEGLIALNTTALTKLTRHALPGMLQRARGGVLNVGSLGGYVPGPNQAAYYASKAYVCSLTSALGAEISGSGVRMTVLAPGPVSTAFHAQMGADNSLYRWVIPAVSPERAARAGVRGFWWGWRVVVPGAVASILAVCVSVLPQAVTVPIMKYLLAK